MTEEDEQVKKFIDFLDDDDALDEILGIVKKTNKFLKNEIAELKKEVHDLRKEKWHDLRKNPEDLPKCTENEQVIFYVKEYYEGIEKYRNHYCLGFYKKSFLNDDVKLFVERSKGYECEHSTEDVLRWCELPKFEE